MDLQLVNYTPGTLSHADYTTPDEKNYRNSQTIYQSIVDFEQKHSSGIEWLYSANAYWNRCQSERISFIIVCHN